MHVYQSPNAVYRCITHDREAGVGYSNDTRHKGTDIHALLGLLYDSSIQMSLITLKAS